MGMRFNRGVEELIKQGICKEILQEVQKTWQITYHGSVHYAAWKCVPENPSESEFAFVGKEHTNRMCLFETPIDLLAVATISHIEYGHNFSDNHMVCIGLTSRNMHPDRIVDQFIKDHPFDCAGSPQIIFYLHNTDGSRERGKEYREKYEKAGYMVVLMSPVVRETFIEELADALNAPDRKAG